MKIVGSKSHESDRWSRGEDSRPSYTSATSPESAIVKTPESTDGGDLIGSFKREIRKPVGGISVLPPQLGNNQLAKKLEERRLSSHEHTIKSPVDEKPSVVISPTEPKSLHVQSDPRSKSPKFTEALVDRWDSKLEEVTLAVV